MTETVHFSDLEPKLESGLPVFKIPEINAIFTHSNVLIGWDYKLGRTPKNTIDYIIANKTKTLFLWQYSAMMIRNDLDYSISKKKYGKLTKHNITKFLKYLPNSRIIICCNNEESLNSVPTEYGDRVSGIVCNHNATIDRNKFTLGDRAVWYRNWDSVYIARVCAQKRHYLAGHLNNIALITGGATHFNGFDEAYKTICSNLSDKNFLFSHKNTGVAKILNDSKVGLCLSEHEGAMYSSTEYLLCGLPIVSTKSKGGRDAFFTDKNCIIAEDTPESVFECVQHWLDNYPTRKRREKIREEAIATQKKHTKVLKDKLKEISPSDIDIDAIYEKRYTHKMCRGTDLPYTYKNFK